MNVRSTRLCAFGAALSILTASAAPAGADIFDDILELVKSARTYAIAARDRAIEARNNAAGARDSANEIRDNLRNSVASFTGDMRAAVFQRAVDLQQQILEEREELDAFTDGDNSCSQGQCEPLRARLLDLLSQVETVLNSVLILSDVGDAQIDFQREKDLISGLSGRLLYPLYRTHFFDDDALLTTLQEATDSLVTLAEVLQEDKEAGCAFTVEHEAEVEQAIEELEDKARFLKLSGKLITALGKIPIQPQAGAWGWVGIVVKLEPAEKIGSALDGVAEALDSVAKSATKTMKGCVKNGSNQKLRKNQKRLMKDVDTMLAYQKEIIEGQQQLQTDVDRILEILGDRPNP